MKPGRGVPLSSRRERDTVGVPLLLLLFLSLSLFEMRGCLLDPHQATPSPTFMNRNKFWFDVLPWGFDQSWCEALNRILCSSETSTARCNLLTQPQNHTQPGRETYVALVRVFQSATP